MSINLQEKINILYDFVYNNINKDCFDIDTIDIKNLKKNDYKITDEKLCDNLLQQLVLDSTMQYFSSDDKNVIFKRFNNQNQLLIKLSVDNIEKQDNDSKISYILSELVLKNKTKHILLPILNLEVDRSKLQLFTNIKSNELINKSTTCGVKIRENFHKIYTLQNYLQENMNEHIIKIILWQIIHTLYVITEKFPYFAHNNLNLNNIFIYQKKIYDTNIEYKYSNNTKIINNTNLEIKITNFENSIINSKNNNDLETLVNSILKLNLNLDLKTKNFLNEILKNNLINIMNNKYFSDITELNDNMKGRRTINTNFSINKINDKNNNVLGEQRLLNNKNNNGEQRLNNKNTRKIKNMHGGDTTYKHEKNTPFVTNDERETKTKKNAENPPREPPVILEQKIYDTHQNKYTPPPLPPATIPVYDNYGSVVAGLPYSNQSNPYYQQAPQKIYNVSIANPMGNYTTISRVFEDIIPGDPRLLGYNSIYERTELIKWLRNIMIQQFDGESMDEITLLSYIKLVDVNPFSLDKNRYKDLARNFLIYRSAYPIRLDDKLKNIQIAKNSVGINVRLYNLTYGEQNAETINNKINKFKFNVWRELEYYNYVKKNIFQKKISQNFISSILYKIDNKSDYKWSELQVAHGKKNKNDGWLNKLHRIPANNKFNKVINKFNSTNSTIKIIYVDDDNYINNKFYNDMVIESNNNKFLQLITYNNKKSYPYSPSRNSPPYIFIEYTERDSSEEILEEYMGNIDKTEFINWIDIIINNDKLDITMTTNKTLILLTESPNNTFLKWISPTYESQGSRQNMISTGYHSVDVYMSIIFQIVYIFAVLQKECIDFEELSLEKNFFIKDLNIDKNNPSYWIYNIDSIDYYVPNYGYLVLFDSKYSDIEDMDINKNKYKINSSKIFISENDDDYTRGGDDKYKSELFNKFKKIIEPNQFNNIVKTKCGIKDLDDKILNLLKTIYDDTNDNIHTKFPKYFPSYLHNRIGTLLLKSEQDMINILYRPNFDSSNGKLVIWQERFGIFKWVLYGEVKNSVTGVHTIYTKQNNQLISIDVNASTLYGYPSDEVLQPDMISGSQINDRFVFEV